MEYNPQQEYVRSYKDETRMYFIEKFLYTYDANCNRNVPFILFPRQKEFLKSLATNANTIAIKHRQAGITTITSAWITAQCVFASEESPETVLCIGNKLDISQQLITKIKNFLNQVPRWMWGPDFYSPDPKSEKNQRSIYIAQNKSYLKLFNGCEVHARSSGENAARGISAVSILVFDEAAFIQNGTTVYAQAAVTTASVKRAKIVMVSTPNGKDELYYRTYSQALKKENNYNAVEFKWFQDLRYNRFLTWSRVNEKTGQLDVIKEETIDENGSIPYNEERWRKLEREGWKPMSPWYKKMCKTLNNESIKIAQELDVSFLGSADNAVPIETIEMQHTQNVVLLPDDWSLKDPFVKETWIWKDPIPGHRYICACDNSSGASDDNTSIQVIDVDAIDDQGVPYVEQVLEYNGKITGDAAGELIYSYATAYNDALVVIEDIGGYGSATILNLLSKRYKNMYYDDPQLKTPTILRKYADYGLHEEGKLPGFHTSSVRFQMISNFIEMLKNNAFRVRSIRVINELETWVFKNGRVDHLSGGHDDNLTCLAMALFVMTFSMLKMERTKEYDKQIVKSWVCTTTTPTMQSSDNKLSITPPKNIRRPFYSSKSFENDRNQKLAMAMFGIKK